MQITKTGAAHWTGRIKDGKGTRGIEPPKSNWALPLDTPPYVGYAVTTGITSKFSGGGGELVCHSSVAAPHGLRPAGFPSHSDGIRYSAGSKYPAARIDAPALDITFSTWYSGA